MLEDIAAGFRSVEIPERPHRYKKQLDHWSAGAHPLVVKEQRRGLLIVLSREYIMVEAWKD
jgi:hypothetical protein